MSGHPPQIHTPFTAAPLPELDRRLDVALSAAHEAGALTLGLFETASLQVDFKPDGTPVTVADRDAEMLLRERVRDAFPHDGVLGEEHGELRSDSGYRWILDPIDGTASFIRGVPLYGTLIGLEHRGEPVAGVIHMPALGQTMFARRAGGAWLLAGSNKALPGNPHPTRVSTTPSLDRAVFCSTSPEYFRKAGRPELFARYDLACAHTRGWSDCYAFFLLASGRVDLVVEPSVSIWDVAAIAPIVRESGGMFTDLAGRSGVHHGSAIASNSLLHEQALALSRS